MSHDYEERDAFEFFRKASEAEDEGNLALAVEFYLKSAAMKFTPAQINLGNIYDDKNEYADHKKAIYWYKRADKLGDSLGSYSMAVHYKNIGSRRWYLYWLRKSANLGQEYALEDIKNLKKIDQ